MLALRSTARALARTRPLALARTRALATVAASEEPTPVQQLTQTYEETLGLLSSGAIPETSLYRQSVQALTQRKLDAVRKAGDDQTSVENALRAIGEIGVGGLTADEGIEGALDTALDELKTAHNVAQWKSYEPLEELAPARQWEYFSSKSSS